MRKGKAGTTDSLTTEERLPEGVLSENGSPSRYGTKGKAVAGSPNFQRPAYTDPWSGNTFPWTPYTNMDERQVIIVPRFYYDNYASFAGINLRGVIQDSGITDLDVAVRAIDWFWEDIYTRLAFRSLQMGKRIAVMHLNDASHTRQLFERWLAVAMGIYGLKSLWDANAMIPAVATWKTAVQENGEGLGDQINLLFDLIHTFPVPQGFVDMAYYYGVGVAADSTGPVFVGLTSAPDLDEQNVMQDMIRGEGTLALSYLRLMRLMFNTLTNKATTWGADDWAIWNVLALSYPTPTPRPTTWRTDPEAVRLILSEACVRTTGGLTWACNPRENSSSTLPVTLPIHGKSPYAATLFRPHLMIGTGLATPDWAWGSMGCVPWECLALEEASRESRVIVMNNRPGMPASEWSKPDGSIDTHGDSNPWNQYLWGPPTIDDHELDYDKQIQQHHRYQDESIAYITRHDLVMNTVALLERFFTGMKPLSGNRIVK